jgi:hypothetical protein
VTKLNAIGLPMDDDYPYETFAPQTRKLRWN